MSFHYSLFILSTITSIVHGNNILVNNEIFSFNLIFDLLKIQFPELS